MINWSQWGKAARAEQIKLGITPRAKVFRACPYCTKEFGARDYRKHIPTCKEKGKKKK